MGSGRKYDGEYKVNAVKLAEKIGAKKAADELDIPDNTLYGWVRAAKLGHLNVGTGYRTPEDNLNLAEENAQLKTEYEKECRRADELEDSYWKSEKINKKLKEENNKFKDLLKEAKIYVENFIEGSTTINNHHISYTLLQRIKEVLK